MERRALKTVGSRMVMLLAALVAGCGSAPDGPASITRDSAGVEVVESVRPAWEEGQGWAVGTEPTLRIGAVDGAAAHQLSGVTGAVRLADGSIAVSDMASQEVRFFGPAGAVRAVVGGTGAGPGEFTGLSAIGPAPAGGVWAYDLTLRRVTWLDAAGGVRALTPVGPEPALLSAVGALPDGSFVLKQLWGARAVAEARRAGLRRDPVAYVRLDSASSSMDTVGLFPGREVYLSDETGRGVMSRPVFGRNSVAVVRGDRVVIGSQDRFELAEYRPDGTLTRVIRLPSEGILLDDDAVDRYLDRYLDAVEPQRRRALRSVLEQVPTPETRPAYGGLLVDAEDHLWVSDWTVIHSVTPGGWTVIDPAGRWLGRVEMPGNFYPLDIGGDWIVGMERDAMDVEHVVVYPLDRRAS